MLLLSTWRGEVFIIINWLLVITPPFQGVDTKNTCWKKEFQVFQLTINYQYNSNTMQKTISGDNTDQNGGRYPILGAYFGLKSKIWLSYFLEKQAYFLEK